MTQVLTLWGILIAYWILRRWWIDPPVRKPKEWTDEYQRLYREPW